MENKRLLITGGAGFIGSNIVEYLLSNNKINFIRILDNLSTGKKNNIEHLLKKYSNLEFMYGDISNIEVCRKAMIGIDFICHQAALGSVPRSVEDPLNSHISNVNGFLNILISAKENNIKRIVYASSSSVYGDDARLPKQEDNTGKVLSPYAATKLIDEIYAGVFTKCYGMECIGLRYFNIFGPRQDPFGQYAAVIPKFIDLIKKNESPVINGDGNYSRDFTYVENAVYANYLALTTDNKNCFGQAFNIGCEGQITILELFNTIKQNLNMELEPIFGEKRQGDIPHSNADITKAKDFLGYRCLVDFKEGIKKTIEYYKYSHHNKINKLLIEKTDYSFLLNREPIIVDNEQFAKTIKNDYILITGGCGSIGSEIVRQIVKLGINNIIIYDNSECGVFNFKNELNIKNSPNKIQFILGNILDTYNLNSVFSKYLPKVVFHCAAYKHVPIMEENPNESIKVNILGTKNVADLALKYNIEKFIMVSTDKAVNPTSVMGASKRISEIYINHLNLFEKTIFITTRFGNVLGSSGSVIPTFIEKIKKNENLEITHPDITRYFMTIPEAAQLVIHSYLLGSKNEILLFDMGKPIKIVDIAKKLINYFNDMEFVTSSNIIYVGLRPGEKLFEELSYLDETILPTTNKHIMKLRHTLIENDKDFLKKFEFMINNNYYNIQELKQKIKEIISEYNH